MPQIGQNMCWADRVPKR